MKSTTSLNLFSPVSLAVLGLFIFSSWQHGQTKPIGASPAITPASTKRAAVKGLSREHAAFRASVISDLTYKMDFVLSMAAIEPSGGFSGIESIGFNLKDNQSPLTLDFFQGKVQSLTVNG